MLFVGMIVLLLLEERASRKVMSEQGLSRATCRWLGFTVGSIAVVFIAVVFKVISVTLEVEHSTYLYSVPGDSSLPWLIGIESIGITVVWGYILWRSFRFQLVGAGNRSELVVSRRILTIVVVVVEHLICAWLIVMGTAFCYACTVTKLNSILAIELFVSLQAVIVLCWMKAIVSSVETRRVGEAYQCVITGFCISMVLFTSKGWELWSAAVAFSCVAVWLYLAIISRVLYSRFIGELR